MMVAEPLVHSSERTVRQVLDERVSDIASVLIRHALEVTADRTTNEALNTRSRHAVFRVSLLRSVRFFLSGLREDLELVRV